MSLFARPFLTNDSSNSSSFHPLFRLLDDFDAYSRTPQSLLQNQHHGGHQRATFFNPRFDVREHEESYELVGELPGVAQKDVELEFTDPQTLIVRGRSEREYSSGTPPTGGAIEPAVSQGRITEAGDHHATVEEAVDESEATNGATDKAASKENTSTEVAQPATQQKAQPQTKYWVSERSVGSFSRSFNFPSRIDQDAVKASLKNGILSVVVPKARKIESRKITIDSE
jgi:HSP20 family protein